MRNGISKSLLNHAKEEEKRYEWLHAAGHYKSESDWMVKSQDFIQAAKVYERIAYSYYRAGFQA